MRLARVIDPGDLHAVPPPKPTTILSVQDELLAMPEWERVTRVRHLGMSIRLFERNSAELLTALDVLTRDPRTFHLGYVSQRAALDAVLEQLIHLLHDFVAAARSLVDHTRVLYDALYKNANLFPDYQDEINKRFVNEPLIQFVQCLRHLAQHVRLPNITFGVDVQQGQSPTRRILLSKVELLQSPTVWNARAKEYLANAPAKIDLEQVVRAYCDAVRRFYAWMQQRQVAIHEDDVAAIARKQQEGIDLIARDVPRQLELGLSILVDHGVGDISAVFAPLLAPTDWGELAKLTGDRSAWVDGALAIIEKRFGVLPRELADRIRAVATQVP